MQVPSLAFPCGVAPGFDPTHPAAASTLLSAIASGGNMVSIVGKPGVAAGLTSTPTAVIDGKIGPATTYAQGGGQDSAWAGFATNTPSAFTMAAICVPVTHGGAAQCLVYDNPSGTGGTKSGLLWNNTGVAKWGISTSSFISTSTTPNVVVGVPYFVAASMLSAVGFNLVAARLDTGQITSEFVSSATTLAAWTGTLNVGNQNGNNGLRSAGASIAAAMVTQGYCSIPQLLAWAQNPWGFWYPGNAS